tara:strand:+ start:261 stop:437 length:177 start_codon:yes stop_codon:yes gene_type:complete
MSKAQTPLCRVGTEFPAGKVKAINNDHVLLETTTGVVKKFSFTQIERFIYEQRSLSQA